MNSLFKTVTDSADHVVSLRQTHDTMHCILIEGLEIKMSIGILDTEKQTQQRVMIDAKLTVEPTINYEENIDKTVSYADVIEQINELCAAKHYNLVETLADDIATQCLTHSKVQAVTLSVKKPDIIDQAQAVGFSLTRERA